MDDNQNIINQMFQIEAMEYERIKSMIKAQKIPDSDKAGILNALYDYHDNFEYVIGILEEYYKILSSAGSIIDNIVMVEMCKNDDEGDDDLNENQRDT